MQLFFIIDYIIYKQQFPMAIARTPALQPGKYTLTIVTRYAGSKYLLKETRTLTYASPLTVE
jgi:hypothetical protein